MKQGEGEGEEMVVPVAYLEVSSASENNNTGCNVAERVLAELLGIYSLVVT